MTDNDRKLLAEIIRAARDVAQDVADELCDDQLLRALDRYDLKAEERIA